MDESKIKQIDVLYEQLLGLFHGLGTPEGEWHSSGGPIIQYEKVIRDLSNLIGEDLKHFLPETNVNEQGTWYVSKDLKAQVSSVLSWLRAKYLPEKSAPHYIQPTSPTTSVSQTVNQEVNVMQVVALDVVEMLTAKQTEFNEGTAERSFIEKIKSGLRSVKDTASLLALIAQTAQQCGLTADQLSKIFS